MEGKKHQNDISKSKLHLDTHLFLAMILQKGICFSRRIYQDARKTMAVEKAICVLKLGSRFVLSTILFAVTIKRRLYKRYTE